MGAKRSLAFGVITAALVGGASASLPAELACQKHCGCGSTYAGDVRFTNECPDRRCAWVQCTIQLQGCSDNFNDICNTPDWCENGIGTFC
jgi:hypothetical protein